MQSVDIEQAQDRLPELVDQAAGGDAFVIEKAGKPLVKVVPIEETAQVVRTRRFGFLAGQISVPDDFDTMGQDEIEEMFGLKD